MYELQSDNLLKNGYTTFENGLNVDISKTNKESEGLIGTARKYIRKVGSTLKVMQNTMQFGAQK